MSPWKTRAQRLPKAHQPRNRRQRFGELVQIDGCDESFEIRGGRCTLLVYVDDKERLRESRANADLQGVTIHPDTVHRILRRAAFSAGIPGTPSPAVLRRSLAVHLFDNEVDTAVIVAVLRIDLPAARLLYRGARGQWPAVKRRKRWVVPKMSA